MMMTMTLSGADDADDGAEKPQGSETGNWTQQQHGQRQQQQQHDFTNFGEGGPSDIYSQS